ncbi:glycoside hydrolase family 25 protein [Streptomyces murinus]|uniref:glycoside hydrolase family 25 protein n=1 Tax=Streptomyces murinus TaxID=33900 RepID=UPI00382A50E7
MTVKGIDVSSYQSSDFSTAGLDFVIIKASKGAGYVNPKMVAQTVRARKAGLIVGFYHFLRPGDMVAQAQFFTGHVCSMEGDPLFADWEDPGVSAVDKDRFLSELKKLRGNGHRIGLYCNRDYWLNRDKTSNAGDALWIADYVNPGAPRITAPWLFHQYAEHPIDSSVARFSDRAALRAWATVKQN